MDMVVVMVAARARLRDYAMLGRNRSIVVILVLAFSTLIQTMIVLLPLKEATQF